MEAGTPDVPDIDVAGMEAEVRRDGTGGGASLVSSGLTGSARSKGGSSALTKSQDPPSTLSPDSSSSLSVGNREGEGSLDLSSQKASPHEAAQAMNGGDGGDGGDGDGGDDGGTAAPVWKKFGSRPPAPPQGTPKFKTTLKNPRRNRFVNAATGSPLVVAAQRPPRPPGAAPRSALL